MAGVKWIIDRSLTDTIVNQIGDPQYNLKLIGYAGSTTFFRSTEVPTLDPGHRSLQFDGTQHAECTGPGSDFFNPENRNFTISFFFKVKVAKPAFLVSKGNATSDMPGWSFYIEENAGKWQLVFRICDISRRGARASRRINLPTSTSPGWHHVTGVIIRDGQNLRLQTYLSGDKNDWVDDIYTPPDINNPPFDSIENAAPFLIGHRNNNSPRPDVSWNFSGHICQVGAFNRVLEDKEIIRMAFKNNTQFDQLTYSKLLELNSLYSVTKTLVPEEHVNPQGDIIPDNVKGDNYRFAHPVSAALGEHYVVVYSQNIMHASRQRDQCARSRSAEYPQPPYEDTYTSGAMAIVSKHRGNNWMPSINLKDGRDAPSTMPLTISDSSSFLPIATGLRAIGTHFNKIYCMTESFGLFTYEIRNDGKDPWQHYPDAYLVRDNPGSINQNVGPNIVKLGERLCLFHSKGKHNSRWYFMMGFSEPIASDNPSGSSWRQRKWLIEPTTEPDGTRKHHFLPVEPASVVYHNPNGMDKIVLIARNYATNGSQTSHTYMVMYADVDDLERELNSTSTVLPFTVKSTNITVGGFNLDASVQDTPDIIFNPDTNCFEALIVSRAKTFQAFSNQHMPVRAKTSLSLWSIEPDVLFDSSQQIISWEAKCELLSKRNNYGGWPVGLDGMHVAGSFLEEPTRHTHVTHFYSGNKCWSSGLFQLKRTTNTKLLKTNIQRVRKSSPDADDIIEEPNKPHRLSAKL